MTGNLLFSNTGDTNGNALGIGGVNGANDGWAIRGYQTSQNRGCLEIAVGDDGDEGIYVRQYTSGQYKLPFMNKAGSASGLTYREIVLMDQVLAIVFSQELLQQLHLKVLSLVMLIVLRKLQKTRIISRLILLILKDLASLVRR